MDDRLQAFEKLTPEERRQLLYLARQALQACVCGEKLAPLDLDRLQDRLREPGASFVTLASQGALRGCIGALEPVLPLAEDVRLHTIAAALQDYRFPPVCPEELPEITIEISRLTRPSPLKYDRPEDLARCLRAGVDGVVLVDGVKRSTFLPQVWSKIPTPEDFLGHLCLKMGADPDLWRRRKLQVYTYRVEEFCEKSAGGPLEATKSG